jgi:hypothetical protein
MVFTKTKILYTFLFILANILEPGTYSDPKTISQGTGAGILGFGDLRVSLAVLRNASH